MILLYIALACGLVALLYGIVTSRQVLSASAGNQRMIEVAGAIQEGASAYLRASIGAAETPLHHRGCRSAEGRVDTDQP